MKIQLQNFSILFQLWNYFYIIFIAIILLLLKIITFTHIILCYLFYCIYAHFTSSTFLFYTKNEKNDNILSQCPNISKPNFKPHFLFPFAFQQMLICNSQLILLSNKQKLSFRTEKVNKYGVTLYWPYFSDSEEISTDEAPILFFCPGMTGGITDPYVLNLVVEGLKQGYHVCIYEMRILNKNFSVDESKIFKHCEDIDLSLETIRQNKKYGKAKIYAMGSSFGANNLLYYLGEKNSKFNNNQKKILAAVSLSNPYDMLLCERLCEGSIISTLVTTLERRNSKKIRKSMEKCPYLSDLNLDQLESCDDVKLFDEIFSSRLSGYRSADEYYRNISAVNKIDKIDIPVLCINSRDDPITPEKAIAFDDIKVNPNIFLLVTDRGGHMAFISGEKFMEFKQWSLKPTFEFLNYHSGIHEKVNSPI